MTGMKRGVGDGTPGRARKPMAGHHDVVDEGGDVDRLPVAGREAPARTAMHFFTSSAVVVLDSDGTHLRICSTRGMAASRSAIAPCEYGNGTPRL
jgi:hypothetical protein